MFDVSPVIDEIKEPTPEPSVVFEFAIVGEGDVLQQIPRAVTALPPVSVIIPPLLAEAAVIDSSVITFANASKLAFASIFSSTFLNDSCALALKLKNKTSA